MADPRNVTGTVPENFRIIGNFKNITLQCTKNDWNPFIIKKLMLAQRLHAFRRFWVWWLFYMPFLEMDLEDKNELFQKSQGLVHPLILGVRASYFVWEEYYPVLHTHQIWSSNSEYKSSVYENSLYGFNKEHFLLLANSPARFSDFFPHPKCAQLWADITFSILNGFQ